MITHAHNDMDALPRVTRTRPDGTVRVHLPARLEHEPGPVSPRLVAHRGGRTVVLTEAPSPDGVVYEVQDRAQRQDPPWRRRACTPAQRPYVVMRERMREHGCRYFEARLDDVPAGTALAYGFAFVRPGDPEPAVPCPGALPWLLHASNPRWDFADIIGMDCGPGLLGQYSCVVYHRESDGLHHVRVDASDLATHLESLRVRITVGGRVTEWRFPEPDRPPWPVALIDRGNDYVVVSRPADGPVGPVVVTVRGPAAPRTVEIADVAQAHQHPGYLGTANLLLRADVADGLLDPTVVGTT
jgi:hypothetical protein